MGWADPPPLDTTGYGQQAGGTHPTRMHSYFGYYSSSDSQVGSGRLET